jgi:hypothetical protein
MIIRYALCFEISLQFSNILYSGRTADEVKMGGEGTQEGENGTETPNS